jgi:NADH:ubiquinone oxidoreductase subunit 5 (subunit L)/multisubunit Na+/H+ antiporter MnhA subunit
MGRTFKFSIYLWINYIIGSLCLIGLPYFSGYYYKYYLLNNLINNFIYLKGGEFFLLISYFFTIFYTFRLGYLVFLNKKNGHKILYKNKKIAIIYIISLLFLGFMILSYHYF